MFALSQARFWRPVCFTGAEGFARGFLSSRRATLSASLKNSANSNYSRTYVPPPGRGVYRSPGQTIPTTLLFPLLTQKQGGVPFAKCRRADIFSLFSPNLHPRPSCSSISCALFHFPYPAYLPPFQYLPHSSPENRGYTSSGHANHISHHPPTLLTRLFPLPHLLPLPPLPPSPQVPTPGVRASTTTSNSSATPTEVTPE